jgi:hypothetical protein
MSSALDSLTLTVTSHQPLRPSADLVEASYRSDSFPQHLTPSQREQLLVRYGLWLRLKVLLPRARLAPTRLIDEMWHLHMLCPVAYHRDCLRWFGRILDHDGGFGKRPEEVEQLRAVFNETARRFEETFGVPYRDDGAWMSQGPTSCWHDCQDRCWHACSEVS